MDSHRGRKKRRSSILKPPKARQPLQDVDFNQSAAAEDVTFNNTRTRRVSFSGTHIKEFHADAEVLTLWGSSYEEKLKPDASHVSDSSRHSEAVGHSSHTFRKNVSFLTDKSEFSMNSKMVTNDNSQFHKQKHVLVRKSATQMLVRDKCKLVRRSIPNSEIQNLPPPGIFSNAKQLKEYLRSNTNDFDVKLSEFYSSESGEMNSDISFSQSDLSDDVFENAKSLPLKPNIHSASCNMPLRQTSSGHNKVQDSKQQMVNCTELNITNEMDLTDVTGNFSSNFRNIALPANDDTSSLSKLYRQSIGRNHVTRYSHVYMDEAKLVAPELNESSNISHESNMELTNVVDNHLDKSRFGCFSDEMVDTSEIYDVQWSKDVSILDCIAKSPKRKQCRRRRMSDMDLTEVVRLSCDDFQQVNVGDYVINKYSQLGNGRHAEANNRPNFFDPADKFRQTTNASEFQNCFGIHYLLPSEISRKNNIAENVYNFNRMGSQPPEFYRRASLSNNEPLGDTSDMEFAKVVGMVKNSAFDPNDFFNYNNSVRNTKMSANNVLNESDMELTGSVSSFSSNTNRKYSTRDSSPEPLFSTSQFVTGKLKNNMASSYSINDSSNMELTENTYYQHQNKHLQLNVGEYYSGFPNSDKINNLGCAMSDRNINLLSKNGILSDTRQNNSNMELTGIVNLLPESKNIRYVGLDGNNSDMKLTKIETSSEPHAKCGMNDSDMELTTAVNSLPENREILYTNFDKGNIGPDSPEVSVLPRSVSHTMRGANDSDMELTAVVSKPVPKHQNTLYADCNESMVLKAVENFTQNFEHASNDSDMELTGNIDLTTNKCSSYDKNKENESDMELTENVNAFLENENIEQPENKGYTESPNCVSVLPGTESEHIDSGKENINESDMEITENVSSFPVERSADSDDQRRTINVDYRENESNVRLMESKNLLTDDERMYFDRKDSDTNLKGNLNVLSRNENVYRNHENVGNTEYTGSACMPHKSQQSHCSKINIYENNTKTTENHSLFRQSRNVYCETPDESEKYMGFPQKLNFSENQVVHSNKKDESNMELTNDTNALLDSDSLSRNSVESKECIFQNNYKSKNDHYSDTNEIKNTSSKCDANRENRQPNNEKPQVDVTCNDQDSVGKSYVKEMSDTTEMETTENVNLLSKCEGIHYNKYQKLDSKLYVKSFDGSNNHIKFGIQSLSSSDKCVIDLHDNSSCASITDNEVLFHKQPGKNSLVYKCDDSDTSNKCIQLIKPEVKNNMDNDYGVVMNFTMAEPVNKEGTVMKCVVEKKTVTYSVKVKVKSREMVPESRTEAQDESYVKVKNLPHVVHGENSCTAGSTANESINKSESIAETSNPDKASIPSISTSLEGSLQSVKNKDDVSSEEVLPVVKASKARDVTTNIGDRIDITKGNVLSVSLHVPNCSYQNFSQIDDTSQTYVDDTYKLLMAHVSLPSMNLDMPMLNLKGQYLSDEMKAELVSDKRFSYNQFKNPEIPSISYYDTTGDSCSQTKDFILEVNESGSFENIAENKLEEQDTKVSHTEMSSNFSVNATTKDNTVKERCAVVDHENSVSKTEFVSSELKCEVDNTDSSSSERVLKVEHVNVTNESDLNFKMGTEKLVEDKETLFQNRDILCDEISNADESSVKIVSQNNSLLQENKQLYIEVEAENDYSYEKLQFPGEKLQCPGKKLPCPSEELQCSSEELQCPSEELQCPSEELHCQGKELQCPNEDEELQCPSKEFLYPSKEFLCPSKELVYTNKDLRCPDEELQCPNENLQCPGEESRCFGKELQLSKNDNLFTSSSINKMSPTEHRIETPSEKSNTNSANDFIGKHQQNEISFDKSDRYETLFVENEKNVENVYASESSLSCDESKNQSQHICQSSDSEINMTPVKNFSNRTLTTEEKQEETCKSFLINENTVSPFESSLKRTSMQHSSSGTGTSFKNLFKSLTNERLPSHDIQCLNNTNNFTVNQQESQVAFNDSSLISEFDSASPGRFENLTEGERNSEINSSLLEQEGYVSGDESLEIQDIDNNSSLSRTETNISAEQEADIHSDVVDNNLYQAEAKVMAQEIEFAKPAEIIQANDLFSYNNVGNDNRPSYNALCMLNVHGTPRSNSSVLSIYSLTSEEEIDYRNIFAERFENMEVDVTPVAKDGTNHESRHSDGEISHNSSGKEVAGSEVVLEKNNCEKDFSPYSLNLDRQNLVGVSDQLQVAENSGYSVSINSSAVPSYEDSYIKDNKMGYNQSSDLVKDSEYNRKTCTNSLKNVLTKQSLPSPTLEPVLKRDNFSATSDFRNTLNQPSTYLENSAINYSSDVLKYEKHEHEFNLNPLTETSKNTSEILTSDVHQDYGLKGKSDWKESYNKQRLSEINDSSVNSSFKMPVFLTDKKVAASDECIENMMEICDGSPSTSKIEDEIRQAANKDDCLWSIKQMSMSTWTFQFLFQSLDLVFEFVEPSKREDSNEARQISKVYLFSRLTDKTDQLAHLVQHSLLSKFTPDIFTQLCSTSLDVLRVLQLFSISVERSLDFMMDVDTLEATMMARFCERRISVVFDSIKLLLSFEVTVGLSNWEELSPSDIKVSVNIGDIDQEDIQNLVLSAQKGPHMLHDYIRLIKNYVRTVELYS